MAQDTAYAQAKKELGSALQALRREAGSPSLDRIIKWGAKTMPGASAMAKGPVSEALAGKRSPQTIDRLLWLVRALMAFEDGEEIDAPGRRDPRLDPWRARWNALQDARQAQRSQRSESASTVPPAAPTALAEVRITKIADPAPKPQQLYESRAEQSDWPLALRVLLARRNKNPISLAGFTCSDRVVSASFSTVDEYLTVALSNGDVLRWDVEKLEIVSHFNPDPQGRRTDRVTHFAFSNSGRFYACSEIAKPLAVWEQDSLTGRFDLRQTPDDDGSVDLLSVADNGTTLFGGARSGLQVDGLNPALQPDIVPLDRFTALSDDGRIQAASISSTGNLIAYADKGRVEVARLPRFEILGTWSCRVGYIHALEFSQGGELLAVGGSEGVEIFDLRGGRGARAKISSEFTHGITFSGQSQIFCAETGKVATISLRDGEIIYRRNAPEISIGAFSLDSSVLAVVRKREIELWG
ncbi:WD40 repeat domain-containing protein [Streptomyces sp. NPDC057651]|uniref:WD40 repeat domain-containing protein n=1 Tax=Streptomyces sp. NPDC057651 TaxID=3346194 RepID=UPI003673E104